MKETWFLEQLSLGSPFAPLTQSTKETLIWRLLRWRFSRNNDFQWIFQYVKKYFVENNFPWEIRPKLRFSYEPFEFVVLVYRLKLKFETVDLFLPSSNRFFFLKLAVLWLKILCWTVSFFNQRIFFTPTGLHLETESFVFFRPGKSTWFSG